MTTVADISRVAVSAENSFYSPEENEISEAIAASIMDGLPMIARSLGIIYAVLTAAHFVMLPPEQRLVLAPTAALSAIIYFGFFFYMRGQEVQARYAHAIAGTFGLIGLFNSLLHLAISADPLQSTNLILITLATGALYLSTMWFWLTVTISFLGWLSVVFMFPSDPNWVHFGIGLVLAIVIGAVINRVRLRNSRQVHTLRIQQAKQQEKIEAARDQLEARVEERTAELNDLNVSLIEEAAERKRIQEELKMSREELLIERELLEQKVQQQTAELRKANAALQQVSLKKDEALLDVSSDFRPMLHEILSNTEILNEQLFGDLNNRQSSLVESIHSSGNRLLAMLDDVKNVSRLDAKRVMKSAE